MNPVIKSVLRAVAGIAILGIGIFVAKSLIGMKDSPPVSSSPRKVKLVKVQSAEPSSVSPVAYIQGRTVAKDKIEIYAEVSGILLPQSKEFREGVRFNSGETMLRIDGEELRMSLIAQRSAFLQALTASLADFKVDYPDRYEEWRRYTADFKVNESVKPLPEPKSDQEKFFVSNRGLLNQYYTIQASEERLSKYTISAPFSGEVAQGLVTDGSLVRVGQKLGDFIGSGAFEVESAISATALNTVRVGDAVTLTAEADGRKYNGKVARILETIDASTQSARVFCSVEGEGLHDGMYLNGAIYSSPLPDAVQLDIELLQPNNSIYVVEDTILKLIPVTVMYRSERDFIVTGIRPGTTILTEQIANAFDGMVVKVANE